MLRRYIGSRTRTLAIITFVLITVFIVRLFQLQILDHGYYAAQARAEQTKQWELPAVRGEIYAMDGNTPKKIVLNQTVYKLWVDPSVVTETTKVLDEIEKVAGGDMVENASSLIAKKSTRYQVLATGLSYDQANEIKAQDLYGVGFESSDRRVYPEGQLGSQVLGFVNGEGQGQYGIEGELNSELAGKPGVLKTVTDVRDVPLTIGKDNVSIPAQDGKNVVLTLDENVQSEAEQILPAQMSKLGATQGSLLVMDPNNGRVLAMANYPTYDPTKINQVTDVSVFNNPIISHPYEPASVIKTLTMSTGIDQGIMTPESTYINTGSVSGICSIPINNAEKLAKITGKITMQTVLNWSLNTGTVNMAEWLGGGSINEHARDILYQYYHDRFRLGYLTGIQLQGESPGIIIGPNTGNGDACRYANMTFGQGLDVTTLQVSAAISAIINGGTYYDPSIVAGTMGDDGTFTAAKPKKGTQILKPSTSATMRQMMRGVRSDLGYGAADTPGYYIGTKSGTAQAIINGQYVFNQTTGTYVGFGASSANDKPAYLVMAYVAAPNKQLTGIDASKVFTPMSNWMLNYLKLAPKG